MGHRMWVTVAAVAMGTTSLAAPRPACAQHQVSQPVSSPMQFVATRANAPAEDVMARKVDVDLQNVALSRVIAEIGGQAGVRVSYPARIDAMRPSVSLKVSGVSARDVFASALRGTALEVRVVEGQWVVMERAGRVVAQGTITGKVTNGKTNRPVPGATILLDDATKGVVTGEDGTFRITADVGEHRVTVRAVGFVKQTKRVNVTDAQSVTLEFSIEPSASVLDEVIVTGTVVATERKVIPTPITVISAADIEKRGITRIEQLFRGEIPGVVAIEQGTERYNPDGLGSMATAKLYSRGSSSLDGSVNPLKVFVDGVEMLNSSYLGTIDPKSIERIEIVTGPQAATIYGSGAMGGVMQIFTKKGLGRTTPQVTVNLKYGVMESSYSDGHTPVNNHSLNLAGGVGPAFSYSGNVSYVYSGQWQPNLYDRQYAFGIGANHVNGPFTISGSVSNTLGTNGTYGSGLPPSVMSRYHSGEWGGGAYMVPSRATSKTSGLTLSLNTDYRMTSFWQHHLTVGKSQNNFNLVPDAPRFERPSDSLFRYDNSTGQRTTASYNMTLAPTTRLGGVSGTLTIGANGTMGEQSQFNGCGLSSTATSYVPCASWQPVMVNKSLDDKNWGGFGSLQVGFFDNIYLTLGLRGERNPTYGREHKIDWTPTNGITYTFERGDLSVKFMGSYGRATRPPSPYYRLPTTSSYGSDYDPVNFISQFESVNLTPEYEHGPQGGIELYYGNVGSLTVSHYKQNVSDLIMSVPIDSFFIHRLSTGDSFQVVQTQYQNVADVEKYGWEGTASLNLGPLSLKGTYSWNESRVRSVPTGSYSPYSVGQSFRYVPSHFGSFTAGYAYGGTSLSLVTNFVGKSRYQSNDFIGAVYYFNRIMSYVDRNSSFSGDFDRRGYAKSDLSVSQRLSGWASATLNVTNIGNSYASQSSFFYPALGRQTEFGVSMRFPR